MFVRTVTLRREGDYGYGQINPAKPFLATIAVEGQGHKTELVLSPELSARIVAIIADEVADAGRKAAEAMTAECLNVQALKAPEPVAEAA